MSRIKCKVTDGPRAGFKEVSVPSVEGHDEYFTIEDRFLVVREGDYLLPVRLIARDPQNKTALVQLPVEADSGANRVWVSSAILSNAPDEVAA